jgi:hypothetical protein
VAGIKIQEVEENQVASNSTLKKLYEQLIKSGFTTHEKGTTGTIDKRWVCSTGPDSQKKWSPRNRGMLQVDKDTVTRRPTSFPLAQDGHPSFEPELPAVPLLGIQPL